MKNNDYISVMQFQLRINISCDNLKDTLNINEEYFKQMDSAISLIENLAPDICIFPEMSYHEKYEKILSNLSRDSKLIIFGSTYDEFSQNKTKVYLDGNLYEVIKRYPCGSEPMIRFFKKPNTNDFIKNYLKEHEFYVKGNKVYILNCLEYYQTAYIIARNERLSKNLFGFLVPCSNSNPNVFIEESKAIHNHNENIYSFVCNRIKQDGTCGYGKSYIYGPIQAHEKHWLEEEGITSGKHNASILTLDSKTPSYAYGMYSTCKMISRFGRSDSYINTPQNLKIGNLL